jgi:Secretion system C-terminal sorting domain
MLTIKTKHLVLLLFVFVFNLSRAQEHLQYFDGADTVCIQNLSPASICIALVGDSTNIWQVGPPHKTVFDAAATLPNAILTDTVNTYPPNNTSSFQFTYVPWATWGIFALQWKQKLDMDPGQDGGKIEYSLDAGTTWANVFNDPHLYNFYGFQAANEDTLPNGDFVFSGTDSVWRDVWLCYDMSWLSLLDSIMIRYTFVSDSIDTQKDGWMIDNMMTHLTLIHTVDGEQPEKYLTVYPNPTNGNIQIETRKIEEFHIIEEMQLVNAMGQVVDEWRNVPTKFFVNTQKYSNGKYFLKVRTNIQSEMVPIVIQHP